MFGAFAQDCWSGVFLERCSSRSLACFGGVLRSLGLAGPAGLLELLAFYNKPPVKNNEKQDKLIWQCCFLPEKPQKGGLPQKKGEPCLIDGKFSSSKSNFWPKNASNLSKAR